jgi:hypothetical protein
MAIHAQAHARATTLVAEERGKEKENQRTTAQVIEQVEGEFRVRGFGVTLSKVTINLYVRKNMIGTFPRLVRGYEGLIPPHIFKLLVLAAESFMQINDFNSVIVPWQKIIMRVNELCSITSEGKPKTSIFDRVMRSTNVSLNAIVAPQVEERSICWTTYANILAWFDNFKIFLIEFGFSGVGGNGEPIFDEEMKRLILNVDETEISLDGSKTRAGRRPEVSFHDPHLPLPSLSSAKSSHSCTGIFGINAAGDCVPVHWQLPSCTTSEERERLCFEFL